MRTKTWLAFIISMALVVLLGATQKDTQKDQSAEAKLQAAIIKETVEGDLKGAIEQYENIIALTGAGRATVATALLRLGGCYEKMGLEGARKAYERLVRDFADQSEQVQAARSRLVALGNPAAEERDTDFMTRLIWTSADGVFTHAPSPDGKSMSYTDWESGNLAVHNLEAGTSRVLTDEGTWEQPVQHALSSRWSPDGKKLAYYWYHGSGTQLRILNVDNPKPQVLFEDVSDDADVFPHDWSPDGQHILVSISRTGREELALLPVDGGSPRMLWTFEPGIDLGEIRFSPDGRYVVYSRRPGEVAASDIFILDLNESEEIPLIRHPADDYVFGWSPDGNWILFASDRTGTIGLWAIRVDDGKPQGIPISVKPSAGRIAPLGFAEDGSFYYADVKVARDVYGARIDFDTGTVLAEPTKAIKRYEGSNMNPRYSPDGKSLACVSRRGSMVFPTNRANALCIHSLESGSERVFMDEFVSHGVRAIAGPRWSPDSRSIAVAGHRTGGILNALYLVDLDTGKVTTLLEASPNVRIRGHEFSQDGRQLFYLRRDTKEEVSRILALDLQNGEERELYQTSGINFPWGIAASPDGKWLATMTYPLALSLIPSGGGAPHIIHRFDQLDRILNPEWLPDGKAILVGGRGSYTEARGISLYRVPLEGGEIQEIVLQQRLGDRPTIHPDGQRIAFGYQSNHDSDADVWIMQNFLPEVEDTRKRLAGLQGSR